MSNRPVTTINTEAIFQEAVGNFVIVIRILQRMYGFFDLPPRNCPAFPINNFLLIPAKGTRTSGFCIFG